ncbi:MAG: FHA domain-containing protein [Chloroflexi bacterium]|nr:FHA domain-containing protein [Chloroflexota bacterium]
MKKIMVYALFFILGSLAGYGFVRMVKSKTDLPDIAAILLLAAVICLFLWAASMLLSSRGLKEGEARIVSEKPEAPTEEKPEEAGAADTPSPETPKGAAKKIAKRSDSAWLMPRSEEPEPGFPISKDNVYIGRNPSSDILLNDDSVSRKHSNITRVGGVFTIFDLNSKNGTFVNSQRIQKHILKDGDIVTLGNLSLIFRVPEHIAGEMAEGVPEAVESIEVAAGSEEFIDEVPTSTRRAPALDGPPTGTRRTPHIDKAPTGTKKSLPPDQSPTGTRKSPDAGPKT